MRIVSTIALTTFFFVGCGGGGGSLESRCSATCADRNADEDCEPGADVNCAALCASLLVNSSTTGCDAELDTLLACFEDAAPDICPSPGQLSCLAENSALVQCQNAAVDAGP